MKLLALLIGLLIIGEGVLGLVTPPAFVSLVGFFQLPPLLYVAAVLRVAIGSVLVCAAPGSRAAALLRILGGLIALGGLLTPIIGVQGTRAVLELWATCGPVMVRLWAAAATAIGALVLYALVPLRRAA